MKKSLFLLFICCLTFNAFTQDNYAYQRDFFLNVGDTIYVGNEGKIRAEPSRSGKLIQEAKIGMMLICESKMDYQESGKFETIYNIQSPFIAVKFLSNGNWISGYIWGGLIADAAVKDAKGNMFLLTRTSFFSEEYFFKGLIARVDAKTNEIAKLAVDSILSSNSAVDAKVLSGMGLSNVNNIFRVTFYGEACGIATVSHYYAWDGKSFYQDLPAKNSVGDAGIYSYSEEFLFPSEHKRGDDLIFVRSSEANSTELYFEELDVYDYISETVETLVIYKWNGRSAKKVTGKAIE